MPSRLAIFSGVSRRNILKPRALDSTLDQGIGCNACATPTPRPIVYDEHYDVSARGLRRLHARPTHEH
ncbi:hypothetical protein MTO96_020531 [Rhipicephalus appendiculatus]